VGVDLVSTEKIKQLPLGAGRKRLNLGRAKPFSTTMLVVTVQQYSPSKKPYHGSDNK
jgi:hypothetical protein